MHECSRLMWKGLPVKDSMGRSCKSVLLDLLSGMSNNL